MLKLFMRVGSHSSVNIAVNHSLFKKNLVQHLVHTWELSFFSVFSFFFFSAKEGNGHYWRKKEGKKKEKKEIVKNLEKCDKIVL